MNKTIKIIMIILTVFFLSLYFGKYSSNYYNNKKVLTDEAIKRYEKDLKEGKKIQLNNYIEKEKDYSNTISKLGIKASEIIEKTFSKSLKVIMKYLEKIDNDT